MVFKLEMSTMKSKILACFLLVFIFLGGCRSASTCDCDDDYEDHQVIIVSENIDDIISAVYDYQIYSFSNSGYQYFFLEEDSQDPDQNIIALFSNFVILVQPVSGSVWLDVDGGCGAVYDAETGMRGVILQVDSMVNWISDYSISVWGGVVTDCDHGEWGTYTLEWLANRWVVTDFEVSVAY